MHARWSRPRPAPHALERYAAALRPIGVAATGVPRVEAGADAEAWAAGWLESWAGSQGPVALCPGARHATKRWPESHWVELHRRLRAAGRTVLCLSLAEERRDLPELARAVEADSGTRWVTETLPRMAGLLSRCTAAVTCDSGLMHLAAARGARVLALFGSTAPELGFAPAGEGHAVLCRHEPCQPCTLHGRERCPRRHFRCMLGIAADEVARVVAGLSAGR